MRPSDFGKYYWCIGLADAAGSKIYSYADQVEISPNGAVVLRGPNNLINLSFPAGQWVLVYLCTPDDPTPCAVDRWPGTLGLRTEAPPAEPSPPAGEAT